LRKQWWCEITGEGWSDAHHLSEQPTTIIATGVGMQPCIAHDQILGCGQPCRQILAQ
jgi:hypothetical protein